MLVLTMTDKQPLAAPASPGCVRIVFGSDGYQPCAIYDDKGNDLLPSLGLTGCKVELRMGELSRATLELASVEVEAEVKCDQVTKAAPPETQPKPCIIRIDREKWSVAKGVKITAAEALKRLGKSSHDYGVWERNKEGVGRPRGDHLMREWDNLSEFYSYFTAPRIVNAGKRGR